MTIKLPEGIRSNVGGKVAIFRLDGYAGNHISQINRILFGPGDIEVSTIYGQELKRMHDECMKRHHITSDFFANKMRDVSRRFGSYSIKEKSFMADIDGDGFKSIVFFLKKDIKDNDLALLKEIVQNILNDSDEVVKVLSFSQCNLN